ncbi:MAG: YHS domain-containing protein, partial [Burkholderiales bacterium]
VQPHAARPAPAAAAAGSYINPVCGIALDPAAAKHTVVYESTQYYFCCDGCKLEFEKEPARYAAIQAERLRKTAPAAA